MAAEPVRIEAARLDLNRVRSEVVGHARGDRLEPLCDTEPERELFVVPGSAHRDRHRLTGDPNLERLLDRNKVGLARPSGKPQRVDAKGRVRGRLGHAQQRTRGESRGPPRMGSIAQLAFAQTA